LSCIPEALTKTSAITGCGMFSPVGPFKANLAKAQQAEENGEPNPFANQDPRHKGDLLTGGGMTGRA